MNLLDYVVGRATGAKAAPAPAAWQRVSAAQELWTTPDLTSAEAQGSLYTRLTWVQVAVEAVARIAAATPFEVRRRSGEGSRPIQNHPLELLLGQPNPKQSRFEFLEETFSWYRVTGNAYWFLNRSGPDAAPAELWCIPSHQIYPVPDGQQHIRGYIYDAGDGRKIPLEPWEILHFKTWNPLSRYVGLSPLQALALDAEGDVAAQRYNMQFYSRDNAKMDVILGFADYIDDGAWKRLMAEWREQHGGQQQKRLAMLRGVGPGGVQAIPVGLSRQDMQYLEQRQFTKEEIFARFAPGLASALAINANEANAKVGAANLRELAVYPAHVAVAEKITNELLPVYGVRLVAQFEDVRHKDRQLELLEIAEYGRWHTIDEVRASKFGSDPLPNGEGARILGAGAAPAQPPADALAQAGKALDRRRWREKALKALAGGRAPDVPFTPDYLDDDEAMAVRAALKRANDAAGVAGAFE